jgi:hypothetical protein
MSAVLFIAFAALLSPALAFELSKGENTHSALFLGVVHKDCVESYFVDCEWLRNPSSLLTAESRLRVCVVDSATKSLGLGIIAGACLVNAMQVRKLHLAGSAEGMSLLGQYSSALSNILMAVWWSWDSNPLTAWAECLVQAAGSLAVVALMWRFTPPAAAHQGAAVAVLAIVVALFWGKERLKAATGFSTDDLSLALYVTSNVSFWWARLSQLYATWAAGGDESLFIGALVANVAGSVVRVFTTRKESNAPAAVKPYIVYIVMLNAALNAALLAQWLHYGGRKGGGAAAPPQPVVNERPPSRSASAKAAKAVPEQEKTPTKKTKRPQRA